MYIHYLHKQHHIPAFHCHVKSIPGNHVSSQHQRLRTLDQTWIWRAFECLCLDMFDAADSLLSLANKGQYVWEKNVFRQQTRHNFKKKKMLRALFELTQRAHRWHEMWCCHQQETSEGPLWKARQIQTWFNVRHFWRASSTRLHVLADYFCLKAHFQAEPIAYNFTHTMYILLEKRVQNM